MFLRDHQNFLLANKIYTLAQRPCQLKKVAIFQNVGAKCGLHRKFEFRAFLFIMFNVTIFNTLCEVL